MKHSRKLPTRKMRWFSFSAIILGALLLGNPSVEAGLTLVSSSGSTTYAVFNTTTASGGSATYKQDANGNNTVLLSAGNGLPMLQTPSVPGSSQTFTTSTLSPYFLTSVTNGPDNYGSATTEAYVANSGQQGSFTSQGGVYFSLNTALADALPANSNQASVSFTNASATYTNSGTTSVTFTPGAIISVNGTLGSNSGSFIAAGLATSISINYGEGSSSQVLDTVTLAANNKGATIAADGSGANEFAGVTVVGNLLTGTGTSIDPNSVTISPGMSITVTSFLTLISDPGSEISISDTLIPGFPSGPQYIPDFGSFASSPSVVPEPSTIVLVVSGLALTGLWSRSRRRLTPKG